MSRRGVSKQWLLGSLCPQGRLWEEDPFWLLGLEALLWVGHKGGITNLLNWCALWMTDRL